MFIKRIVILSTLFFIIVVLILACFFIFDVVTFDNFKANRDTIKSIVNEEYYISIILILLAYILSAFGMPITTLLTLVVGFLFGWVLGFMYAIIGITIGALLTFVFSRFIISDLIWKNYSQKIEQINKHMEKDAFKYFVSLRLIPFFPICIANYAGGLSKLSLVEFTLSTIIGKLPYCIIYSVAGDNIINIENISEVYSIKIILLFVFLAVLSLFPILYKYMKKFLYF
ncbi:TVP38/TMEM64 family protein [Abyssisolibacter fermentans]|uniref:TVP38/TMEM64 family protein n=1 Tax=Abyssisolibacter fermentans TaxID=1766203 RepID=UPI00082EE5C8|nr:VTT domain-containing protein [Abyssisolibacter fermentans]